MLYTRHSPPPKMRCLRPESLADQDSLSLRLSWGWAQVYLRWASAFFLLLSLPAFSKILGVASHLGLTLYLIPLSRSISNNNYNLLTTASHSFITNTLSPTYTPIFQVLEALSHLRHNGKHSQATSPARHCWTSIQTISEHRTSCAR